MGEKDTIVNFDKINDMLDDDPAYFNEFCNAAVKSFGSFQEEFRTHMQNRDLDQLRKSGHRIRPVAQMLGVDEIIEEYEQAKEILQNESSDANVNASIDRMENLCNKVLNEFREKIE